MDRQGIERIVRSLLTEYGLPFTVVAVTAAGALWTVELFEPPAHRVHLAIHDGTGASVRRAFMRAFDLEP